MTHNNLSQPWELPNWEMEIGGDSHLALTGPGLGIGNRESEINGPGPDKWESEIGNHWKSLGAATTSLVVVT